MSRVAYVCPACRATVPGPPGLGGEAAPCPKCKAWVPTWPAPLVPATEAPEKPAWHYSTGGANRGPVALPKPSCN